MNRRIRRMMREIERRGGKLYVNPRLPDDITEEFLAEVLACPECAAHAGIEVPEVDAITSESSFDALPRRGDRVAAKGH